VIAKIALLDLGRRDVYPGANELTELLEHKVVFHQLSEIAVAEAVRSEDIVFDEVTGDPGLLENGQRGNGRLDLLHAGFDPELGPLVPQDHEAHHEIRAVLISPILTEEHRGKVIHPKTQGDIEMVGQLLRFLEAIATIVNLHHAILTSHRSLGKIEVGVKKGERDHDHDRH